MRNGIGWLVGVVGLHCLGAAMVAQGPAGGRAATPIAVEQLAPNVYWVQHAGFAAFVVGDKGVIAMDTGRSPAVGKQIVEAIAKVTPKPVTTLILTHEDSDHVDGITAFPGGMKIIAQDNAKQYLEAASKSGKSERGVTPIPAGYLPNQGVANREVVTIDGVKLELLHWAPAHTSGDLVIYLPAEKLVMAGDVLVKDQHDLPLIHAEKGGTSRGWVETVEKMLALDATKYIIGHEGVVGKEYLEMQLKAAVAERRKVKELYDQGKTLAEIEAAVGDPAPVLPGAPPHMGPNFPPFAEVIYGELKAGTF